MSKLKVLIIAASDRIVGGHSVQAREIFNYFTSHRRLEVRRYDIDRSVPHFIQRLPYIRTVINEIGYLAGLIPKILWSDVLHIFSASYWSFLLAPAPAIFLGRIFKKRIILNYHSGEAHDHLSRWKVLVKPILLLADELVVPSAYLQEVFSCHGLAAKIVSNAVNFKRFQKEIPDEPQPLRILCTRNFEDHYRVDRVIEAFGEIKMQIPDAQLILIGDGYCRSKLENIATQKRLSDVLFVGQIDNEEVAEFYKRANLYLNASVVDNMPLSLMEAMAAGLIVVSTASGGIPFLITNGHNGILVSTDDAHSLAKAVVSVYRDRGRWNNIQQNAIEYSRRFSPEVVCKEWERVYVSLQKRVGETF